MAGKNGCFELTQNRLSEKLQPMLKNRHLAIALLNTYFEENRQFDDLFDHQNRNMVHFLLENGSVSTF
jgi:hypothetical protein